MGTKGRTVSKSGCAGPVIIHAGWRLKTLGKTYLIIEASTSGLLRWLNINLTDRFNPVEWITSNRFTYRGTEYVIHGWRSKFWMAPGKLEGFKSPRAYIKAMVLTFQVEAEYG